MPTTTVTDPIILDSTGQSICSAIEGLAAAVKPTAAEMDMSSTDSTKVKAAIDSANTAIANLTSNVDTRVKKLNSTILSDGGTITLNVPNSARAVVVFEAPTASAGYNFFAFVNANTSGGVRCAMVGNDGNAITEDHSVTNKITFTNSSASTGCGVHILQMTGDVTFSS